MRNRTGKSRLSRPSFTTGMEPAAIGMLAQGASAARLRNSPLYFRPMRVMREPARHPPEPGGVCFLNLNLDKNRGLRLKIFFSVFCTEPEIDPPVAGLQGFGMSDRFFQAIHTTVEEKNRNEQEDLSTEQSEAKPDPRFPGTYVNQGWTGCSEKTSRQGAQASRTVIPRDGGSL